MKRLVSIITTFAMIMTLFAGIGAVSAEESDKLTRCIEIIEFGNYPQTEIVDEASRCGSYERAWGKDGDYEINETLYSKLSNDTGWVNDDKTINGVKYHRIKKGNASSSSSEASYYKWPNNINYHFFKYEPIKWRVLSKNDGKALLLADIALDCQKYYGSNYKVTWSTSVLRSWLNEIFIYRAFSSSEQTAICQTTVLNKNSQTYGTSGGDATNDKVFLLSESEVYGKSAVNYGFSASSTANDKMRQATSSTYAKAMGCYADLESTTIGNCTWWLRSPGYDNYYASCISSKGSFLATGSVVFGALAVRPAIYLNVNNSSVYKASSDVVEIAPSDVELSYNTVDYDGKAKQPAITISGLVENQDFTVDYSDNIYAGTAIAVISGIGNYTGTITKEFSITIPKMECTGALSKDVDYPLISFGSYPQTEIVYDKEVCGTYGKEFETASDCIVDGDLYSSLMNATFDDNGDTVIDDVKYHRIKKSDAILVKSSDENYYSWNDEDEYRYFRYDPIKWRVLDKNDNDVFLLADVGLDNQQYDSSETIVTWENCDLRAWLNDIFLNRAFTMDEQTAIIEETLKNDNNTQHGTAGGNDTIDKVYLLSEAETSGDDVFKYGFAESCGEYDTARQAKSSTYAKAMGTCVILEDFLGNCDWWLRTPGARNYAAVGGYGGYVYRSGFPYTSHNIAVRPAIHIDISNSDVYRQVGNTGTVSQLNIDSISLDKDVYPLAETGTTPKVTVGTLKEGEDYTVSYSNNDKSGIATVTVTGKGDWSGSISKGFAIVGSIDISSMEVEILEKNIKYYGKACCPEIKVGNLVKDKDYTVIYEKNNGAGIGLITVTAIKGSGYTGYITKNFKISKPDISEKAITIPETEYMYTGKAIEPVVTIDGLTENIDYTVAYSDNVSVGTATVTVTGVGNWDGTSSRTFKIKKGDISEKKITLSKSEYIYDGSARKPKVTIDGLSENKDYEVSYSNNVNAGTATVTITGKGGFTGTVTKSFKIIAVSISGKKAILKTSKYTYDGKVKKPAVAVSGLNSSEYTVKYSSNTKCGKAKVTITGTGNYKGSITKYFYITPAKSAISKATAGKKKITVTIKSQKASGVSGYQIYYKKAGSSAKSVTTTSTSKVLTGLVKGKKYTVKVRAYKTIDGKKYYGDYSVAKTVKVK